MVTTRYDAPEFSNFGRDYSRPSTYTTPDGSRTAESDYVRETFTVFIGCVIAAVIPMPFARLKSMSMREKREIVESYNLNTNTED